jgi:hypothetical protein
MVRPALRCSFVINRVDTTGRLMFYVSRPGTHGRPCSSERFLPMSSALETAAVVALSAALSALALAAMVPLFLL